jgi:pyruvate/2-oxoglutarate/acetoin dehydrogenase E1 component
VGPALSFIKNFIKKYDVNVIYITTIVPLDKEIIKKSCNKINKIMLIEQYYQSSLNNEISNILNKKINFCNISLPVKFLSNYGTNREIDKEIGFQEKIIEKKLIKFLFNKK